MFYIYEVGSINYDWNNLPTIKNFITNDLFKEEPYPLFLKENYAERYLSDINKEILIIEQLKKCFTVLEQYGWTTTHFQKPKIFFIPTKAQPNYGFVWQELLRGTIFVVTPLEMPHLEERGKKPYTVE